MRRATVFLASSLIIIGVLRIVAPSFVLGLMAMDKVAALLAVVTGVVAILNGWHIINRFDLRVAYRFLGIVLVTATIIAVNNPTLGSLRQTYLPVADIFLVLESGLLALLASTEQYENAVRPFTYLSIATQLLYRRLAERALRHGEVLASTTSGSRKVAHS